VGPWLKQPRSAFGRSTRLQVWNAAKARAFGGWFPNWNRVRQDDFTRRAQRDGPSAYRAVSECSVLLQDFLDFDPINDVVADLHLFL
jgi:hypothetical protein